MTATQAMRVTRRGAIIAQFAEHPDGGSVKVIVVAAPQIRGKTVLEAHVHRDLGEFDSSAQATLAVSNFLESPAALELLDAALCNCAEPAGSAT